VNSEVYSSIAQSDFNKARNKAFASRLMSLFDPGKEELLSFDEVKSMLKPKGETYKGMQAVPIDRIVGSEGRYLDFDRRFRPRHDHLRKRWERVDMAHHQLIDLPPIQLYEIGGLYFVRDGNHRVSVAKAQKAMAIDAEVVSLDSEIQLSPGSSKDELRRAVIEYEKREFYAETFFGDLTDDFGLDFSTTGRYDVVLNHILTHKYYINQGLSGELPFEQALLSWYNSVYSPVIKVIEDERLAARFPGRTKGDLYVWIVQYWDELKKSKGQAFPLEDSAKDFSARFGKNLGTRIGELAARLLRRG
jgi:hypothetical protein